MTKKGIKLSLINLKLSLLILSQPYVEESMKEKGRLMEAGKSLQLDVESGSDGLELVMSKEKPRGIHTKW